MKSTIIIIIFIISVVVTKHHHHHRYRYRRSHHNHKSEHIHLIHILKSQKNTFSKTYENTQSIINNLFGALNLPEEFMDMPKTKLLVIMLYDLNNIAGKNFDLYHTLRNITKVEANNNAVKKIRLDEIVREIINQMKQFEDNKKSKDKNRENAITVETTSVATEPPNRKLLVPIFNQSKEFKQFIRKFLRQVNNFNVTNVIKDKSSKIKRRSRRSLKVWVPPTNLKEFYNKSLGTRRIFHGKRTNIKTFPFVVSIHFLNDFMCSGSIIKDDLIVTAASCLQMQYNNRFFRENAKSTYVRIGSDSTSRLGDLVPVLEIFFYPTYNPKTLRHNLAVLRLGRAIKFLSRRRSKVKRIALDTNNGHLPSNTHEIVMLGWGAKQKSQTIKLFDKLQVSFLPMYPWDDCRRIYSKDYVTEANFCVGYISKGSGACDRDAGAPGVLGGQLVGVVSFGPTVCGVANSPTVFTKIGNYIDWLETIDLIRVPRYGAPTVTRISSKSYVYYHNTKPKRTHPRLYPIDTTRNYRLKLRANTEYEAFEEQTNTEVNSILTERTTETQTALTQEAFRQNYYMSKLTTNNQVARGTIRKAVYIPTVQYEPIGTTAINVIRQSKTARGIRKQQNFVTKRFIPHIETSTAFVSENVYENQNYEDKHPKTEKVIQHVDYSSSDSDISRKEYLEKTHNQKKNSEDDDSEKGFYF